MCKREECVRVGRREREREERERRERERERERRERERERERDLTVHVHGLPRTVCGVTAIIGVALQLFDKHIPLHECRLVKHLET